jgi:hypothetical protein
MSKPGTLPAGWRHDQVAAEPVTPTKLLTPAVRWTRQVWHLIERRADILTVIAIEPERTYCHLLDSGC